MGRTIGHIVIIAVGLVIIGVILFSNRNRPAPINLPNNETATNMNATNPNENVTAPSGLKIEDLKVGTGKEVKKGDTITIHYKGTLLDGKQFDSSYDRGQPFETQIGVGQVIQGWDEGVIGMKVGGKRKLTIPPELGYGAAGAPPTIPPNSTLVFELELLDVK